MRQSAGLRGCFLAQQIAAERGRLTTKLVQEQGAAEGPVSERCALHRQLPADLNKRAAKQPELIQPGPGADDQAVSVSITADASETSEEGTASPTESADTALTGAAACACGDAPLPVQRSLQTGFANSTTCVHLPHRHSGLVGGAGAAARHTTALAQPAAAAPAGRAGGAPRQPGQGRCAWRQPRPAARQPGQSAPVRERHVRLAAGRRPHCRRRVHGTPRHADC